MIFGEVNEDKDRLAVDHCHSRGNVRNLLCMRANIMLGKSLYRPEVLREGAAYVNRWNDHSYRREFDIRYKRDKPLTPLQRKSRLAVQNGKCPICRVDSCDTIFHVDHDEHHPTQRIRDLLCRRCNMMLGDGDHNPAKLIAGAEYLEWWETVTVRNLDNPRSKKITSEVVVWSASPYVSSYIVSCHDADALCA